jgi:hypothetical protein
MFITGYQLRPRHVCSMGAMTLAALAAVFQQSPATAGTRPATTDALTRPQAADRPEARDLEAYRVIVSRRVVDHQEHLVHEEHLAHEAHLTLEKREARETAYVLQHVRRHIMPVVAAQLDQPSARQAPAEPPGAPQGSPQQYAESLVGSAQFGCLDALWERESGWNATAENPGSGAYGIPQSLPGDKMASAGPDWRTDADTQIRWGVLDYIDPTYGDACGAWQHEEADGWY